MNCDLAGQDFKIIAVSNRKLCERPFTEQIFPFAYTGRSVQAVS